MSHDCLNHLFALQDADESSRYLTFADSLLIYKKNEMIGTGQPLIDLFKGLLRFLKKETSANFFCIINDGSEVSPSLFHSILRSNPTINKENNYFHIAEEWGQALVIKYLLKEN